MKSKCVCVRAYKKGGCVQLTFIRKQGKTITKKGKIFLINRGAVYQLNQ